MQTYRYRACFKRHDSEVIDESRHILSLDSTLATAQYRRIEKRKIFVYYTFSYYTTASALLQDVACPLATSPSSMIHTGLPNPGLSYPLAREV